MGWLSSFYAILISPTTVGVLTQAKSAEFVLVRANAQADAQGNKQKTCRYWGCRWCRRCCVLTLLHDKPEISAGRPLKINPEVSAEQAGAGGPDPWKDEGYLVCRLPQSAHQMVKEPTEAQRRALADLETLCGEPIACGKHRPAKPDISTGHHRFFCILSSAVERSPYTADVAGSIPAGCTIFGAYW